MTGGTSEEYSKNNTLQINAVGTGCGGRGIFGGRCGFVVRSGHGSGGRRHCQDRGSPYTPYHPPYENINIKIEACQYPRKNSGSCLHIRNLKFSRWISQQGGYMYIPLLVAPY